MGGPEAYCCTQRRRERSEAMETGSLFPPCTHRATVHPDRYPTITPGRRLIRMEEPIQMLSLEVDE